MCVTGFVHPDNILKNVGAQPGDALVLTKPLGSGILTTGIKAGMVSEADCQAAYRHMATLNAKAGQAAAEAAKVHACTDITGFGLLGHCYEMASGSEGTIRLNSAALPLMSGAKALASMGVIPAGAYRNLDYVKPHLKVEDWAEQALLDLACDPQTSGGLLIALPPEDAKTLLARFAPFAPWSAIVGTVEEPGSKAIVFG